MAKSKVTKAILDKRLSKEVKEAFEVDHTQIKSLKFIDHKFGLIDFTAMSKKTAEKLVKDGCPFIQLKKISKQDSEK